MINVSPHQLRHTFAVHMLAMLIQHQLRGASSMASGGPDGRLSKAARRPASAGATPPRPCQPCHHLPLSRPHRHARRYSRRCCRRTAGPPSKRGPVVTERPRKGHPVAFQPDTGAAAPATVDPVTGLRFHIGAQDGREVLVDYVHLRPRRLSLAFARALRRLAGPGGPLTVRSTVMAMSARCPSFSPISRTQEIGSTPPNISIAGTSTALRLGRKQTASPGPTCSLS